MRRICGCDGYGVPQAKRIGKKNMFFLNLKTKDPESIAAKIMAEYNSKVVSHVHMQIFCTLISAKKNIFLNPRVQPLYCPSLDADSCNLT